MTTKKGGMLMKWRKGGAAVRVCARLRPPGKKWTTGKTNALWTMMAVVGLWGCAAKGDRTGAEFAPQMYHSVAYEPLTQVKDKKAGQWLSSTGKKDSVGEFYNGNPYHPSEMSMREPVPGTVQHMDLLNYLIPKDSLALAARILRSPYAEATDKKKAQVLQEGQVLYQRFCQHCHGKTGQGDGKVGQAYKGVTSYTSRAVKGVSEGHIFHVITYGKGRMKAHGSQLSENERWKIVHYVKTLQQTPPTTNNTP